LLLSVLAAALAVAAGTGCSGDDEGAADRTNAPTTTAPPPAPPTPTEPINAWARQADAICQRFQRRIQAVPPPTNEVQARRALARALVPIRRQERALKRLGPPDDNRAIGLAFIGSIVSTRRALEQIVAGFAAGDEAAVQAAYARAGAAGARTRSYAEQLGLVNCGAPRGG
jgi:hypothetical protein